MTYPYDTSTLQRGTFSNKRKFLHSRNPAVKRFGSLLKDGALPKKTRAAVPQFELRNILQTKKDTDTEYLKWVSDLVHTHKGKTYPLKSPAGATLTVGDKSDTVYEDDVVEDWGEFYLPETVHMQVLGVVEGTSCPEQLVLMICEDKELYVYDGEELHAVASSLEQLCDTGMEYPASRSYYRGQAFNKMTEEDWDEVWNSPAGKILDKEHHELVITMKSTFLTNLNKCNTVDGHGDSRVSMTSLSSTTLSCSSTSACCLNEPTYKQHQTATPVS